MFYKKNGLGLFLVCSMVALVSQQALADQELVQSLLGSIASDSEQAEAEDAKYEFQDAGCLSDEEAKTTPREKLQLKFTKNFTPPSVTVRDEGEVENEETLDLEHVKSHSVVLDTYDVNCHMSTGSYSALGASFYTKGKVYAQDNHMKFSKDLLFPITSKLSFWCRSKTYEFGGWARPTASSLRAAFGNAACLVTEESVQRGYASMLARKANAKPLPKTVETKKFEQQVKEKAPVLTDAGIAKSLKPSKNTSSSSVQSVAKKVN